MDEEPNISDHELCLRIIIFFLLMLIAGILGNRIEDEQINPQVLEFSAIGDRLTLK